MKYTRKEVLTKVLTTSLSIGITTTSLSAFFFNWHSKKEKNEGYSTKVSPAGFKYTGYFKNNKLKGYGIMIFPDGRKYEGYFKNGFLIGNDMIQRPDGVIIITRNRSGKIVKV